MPFTIRTSVPFDTSVFNQFWAPYIDETNATSRFLTAITQSALIEAVNPSMSVRTFEHSLRTNRRLRSEIQARYLSTSQTIRSARTVHAEMFKCSQLAPKVSAKPKQAHSGHPRISVARFA
jgi:hypothetical protein